MKFFNWLMLQKERDDPIGDLANDAANDELFAEKDSSLDCLVSYLESVTLNHLAIEALREAWEEYKTGI